MRHYVLDRAQASRHNPLLRPMTAVLLAIVTAFALTIGAACRPSSSNASTSGPSSASSGTRLFVDAAHNPSDCPNQSVFRCRTVTVNYNVLDKSIAAGPGSMMTINPFEDAVFEAVLTSSEIQTEVPVRKSWDGRIPGYQFSSVGFTYTAGKQLLVGTINCPSTYPKNYFVIRSVPGGSGRHLVLEVDPRDAPQH